MSGLTSDDVDRHVGHGAHRGVTGVMAAVGEGGLPDQEGGAGALPLLCDLTDPATAGAVGDWLEYGNYYESEQ